MSLAFEALTVVYSTVLWILCPLWNILLSLNSPSYRVVGWSKSTYCLLLLHSWSSVRTDGVVKSFGHKVDFNVQCPGQVVGSINGECLEVQLSMLAMM